MNDAPLDVTRIVLLSALVLVTGAVGSITGGNSLVNVPAMMLAGLPPRVAVATNMFAVTFMTASAGSSISASACRSSASSSSSWWRGVASS